MAKKQLHELTDVQWDEYRKLKARNKKLHDMYQEAMKRVRKLSMELEKLKGDE